MTCGMDSGAAASIDLAPGTAVAIQQSLEAADSVQLASATIMLSYRLHYYGRKGILLLADAYDAFLREEYLLSFYLVNEAADAFEAGDRCMRQAEYGVWKEFYANDCLADYKFSAYVLRRLASWVRCLGDGPHFYNWQREIGYSEEDRRVVLITNMENHKTDAELYQLMREQNFMDHRTLPE